MNERFGSSNPHADALRAATLANGFSSAYYAIFVPLSSPLTSTSYNGNDTVTANSTTTIDTSSVFGAPVGIKAALVRVSAVWTAAGTTRNLQVRQTGSSTAAGICRSQVANIMNDFTTIVPCDSNGDFDLFCASGENAGSVTMEIHGYWI